MVIVATPQSSPANSPRRTAAELVAEEEEEEDDEYITTNAGVKMPKMIEATGLTAAQSPLSQYPF